MARRTKQPEKPTRKQIALSRREREQQRRLYIGLAALTVLILIVLAAGLVYSYVIFPARTVAVVNGAEITIGEYQRRVRYERFILDQALQNLQAQVQALAANGSLQGFLLQQVQQAQSQLISQRLGVDRNTLDLMVEELLAVQEAERVGITVTEDAVTAQINNFVAGRAGGYTEAAVAETATAASAATATAALFTPTPTRAVTPTPTLTATEVTPAPTVTATEVITPPTPTSIPPTPLPTPTPVIIAPDQLSQGYTEWLALLRDNSGVSEAEYREIIRRQLVRAALSDYLAEQVETVEEQVHARHILVETEEEIRAVKDRLDAGEDFAEVAAEVSLDTSNKDDGGDLGFFPRGAMVSEFEDVAFSTPVGEVSEPFQTQFGWHVLQVLEKEERELDPVMLSRRQTTAYGEWAAQARIGTVQDFWVPDYAPADPDRLALEQQITGGNPLGGSQDVVVPTVSTGQ